MKKITFSLFLGLFFSITAFAQVTLEHSYTNNGSNNDDPKIYAFFTDSGINYYTFDSDLNKVYLYNSSHILFKTIDIVAGPNYKLSHILLVTDKLFYADNKIEFIAVSRNSMTNKMTLYNEDGTNLFEFGVKQTAEVFKNSNIDYKLVVASNEKINPVLYDVYSLSGTLSENQQGILNKTNFYSFPNPTSNKISFTTDTVNGNSTKLEIFDNSGKRVFEKNMTVNDNKIEIDVTELASGIYIYKLDGRSNKFIKE